ncbi:Hsp70 family protein [Verrucomicrobia bacterium LW23]|nr:Hsp70 family protein [Verrucomicrobia bacterium LW23]
MSTTKKWSIGIDLGTSNSAIAVAGLQSKSVAANAEAASLESPESSAPATVAAPEIVEITQRLTARALGEAPTMASALYIPHASEFPAERMRMPWDSAETEDGKPAPAPTAIVGNFAREHGALTPDRLVLSAKSWLCNPNVDHRAKILPWDSDLAAAEKTSPLEASRLYLAHLRHALAAAAERSGSGWTSAAAEAEVILTVPASFDEAARNLTLEAAAAAGLGHAVLLEEPQAAFYAWMAKAAADWRKQITPGDIILVCDVGGGTADFSLMVITEAAGNLQVERIAVGEHILLGGDNMDLAVAFNLGTQFEEEGKSLDAWQFQALVHGARSAKEKLFGDPALEEVAVAVPSRGSGLLAKTSSTRLTRAKLQEIVLEGFLPKTRADEMPAQRRSTGLRELGLPYADDTALTKHLARFLTRALQNVKASEALSALATAGGKSPSVLEGAFLKPNAILFNGGVFRAEIIRRRVLDVLADWCGAPITELTGSEPDLAVAKGAAYYGGVRATGQGIRIKAGTARSYYIGLESSMMAVPGFKPPIKALCVVPQGMEEGSDLVLSAREFGLVTGEEADFRFFSSEVRSGDTQGQVLPDARKVLEETSTLAVTLPPLPGRAAGDVVPVQLEARVTELGNLELYMKHTTSDMRWKLEFKVRLE